MRAKRVEAGELVRGTPPLQLPAERRMRWGDGRHRGGPFRLEVALVGIALRGPDGSEQAGHGREAASPREVCLRGDGDAGFNGFSRCFPYIFTISQILITAHLAAHAGCCVPG